MLRVVLGVIAGFIAWSILWLGSDQVLMMISPGWYGAHQLAFQKAMFNKTEFTPENTILGMHLLRAVIITLMCGFLAAVIARGNRNAPLGLGILLFTFGAFVQAVAWSYLPVWYHIIFLALLIPMSILGGRLKRSA
jgi:uncharacterized membrane protein YeaQ/YmgE (transglycosylase-associated protein family)